MLVVVLLVARLAQHLAISNVIHALRCNMARHDVVHFLAERGASVAQWLTLQQLVAELPPLPTAVCAVLN